MKNNHAVECAEASLSQEFSKGPDEHVCPGTLQLLDFCLRTYHSQIVVDTSQTLLSPKETHQSVVRYQEKKNPNIFAFFSVFLLEIFPHCCSRSCFTLKTSNGCGFAAAAHFHVSAVNIGVLKTYLSWNSDLVNSFAAFLIESSIIWFSPSSCRSIKHTDSNDIWESTTNLAVIHWALQALLCTPSLYVYTFL